MVYICVPAIIIALGLIISLCSKGKIRIISIIINLLLGIVILFYIGCAWRNDKLSDMYDIDGGGFLEGYYITGEEDGYYIVKHSYLMGSDYFLVPKSGTKASFWTPFSSEILLCYDKNLEIHYVLDNPCTVQGKTMYIVDTVLEIAPAYKSIGIGVLLISFFIYMTFVLILFIIAIIDRVKNRSDKNSGSKKKYMSEYVMKYYLILYKKS